MPPSERHRPHRPGILDTPVPAEWSRTPDPTLREILKAHAYDEAWITGVLAGASVADGDDLLDRDLLGGDPIAAYGTLNDAAPALVGAVVEPGTIFPCADPDTGRASDRPSALGRLQPTRTVGK